MSICDALGHDLILRWCPDCRQTLGGDRPGGKPSDVTPPSVELSYDAINQ